MWQVTNVVVENPSVQAPVVATSEVAGSTQAGAAVAASDTAGAESEVAASSAASAASADGGGAPGVTEEAANQPAPPTREEIKQIFRGRSGFFERLPPRPKMTDEERQQRIAELRKIYEGDPKTWPAPNVDADVQWKELEALPPPTGAPVDPIAKARIELGKRLFFDPRLSSSRQIACASCHDPDLSWTDGRTVAFGHERKELRRNAPAIANLKNASQLFWDGRAKSLEDQALQVLLNPDEMHSSQDLVLERISAIPEYEEAFSQAYEGETVTIELVCRAIADFERSVVGGSSRYDAFLRGNHAALSDEAILGLDLFRRDARCINCHHGPTFSDGLMHNIGLSYYGRKFEDLGMYDRTKVNADVGKFKTPSLRNVSQTGPYMHNGLFPSIRGILNMYNAGMPTLTPKDQAQLDDPRFPIKSPHLRPLGLNAQDLGDLEAFLESLAEPQRRLRPPTPYAEATDDVADSKQ